MKLKLKSIIALILAVPLMAAAPALAASSNPLDAACQTDNQTRASAVCQQAGNQGTTNPIAGSGGIISTAANIIAVVAGVAAVIMIIISGFGYITSGGNTEATAKARQRILGSVIGLVVVGLAWVIVDFVTVHVIK